MWENICVTYILKKHTRIRGLMSRLYKDYYKLIEKKDKPVGKGTETSAGTSEEREFK